LGSGHIVAALVLMACFLFISFQYAFYLLKMFNRFYANHFHFFALLLCELCCVVEPLQTLENHYKIIIIKILACSWPQINYF